MARVLRDVLGEPRDRAATDGGAQDLAAAAAAAIAPAVETLGLLADGSLNVPWDGLVHRRCRIRPAARDAGGADAAAEPQGSGVSLRSVRSAERAGWWIARAEAEVDGVFVIHELARRCAVPAPAAPTRGAPLDAAPGVADPIETGRPAVREPSDLPTAPSPVPAAVTVRLTPDGVATWAEATGDRNALHLHPGAALDAGLPVGPDEVVAHGLLLAALSLAVAPRGDGPVDLRFLAPCTVPAAGCVLDVDPVTGAVRAGGRTLLRCD